MTDDELGLIRSENTGLKQELFGIQLA